MALIWQIGSVPILTVAAAIVGGRVLDRKALLRAAW